MQADIAAIRDTIQGTGEFRVHLIWSRSNLRVTARMWHPDGVVVGVANGGGYDRAGAALGQAISALFGEELKSLPAARVVGDGVSLQVDDGLSGVTAHLPSGGRSLDGRLGLDSMLDVLRALGFDAECYDTWERGKMVLAKREVTRE